MLGQNWWPLALASCSVSAGGSAAPAPLRPDQPVELGAVAWGRDLEAGLDTAERAEKPVLLLFQEIPG
jgi:hypothetical protein